MSDAAEILHTADHLHSVLADLVVRGLRSAAAAQLAPLDALRVEFDRVGAAHLAARISDLVDAIRRDDPAAARAMFQLQLSLRLFERLLTLQQAGDLLTAAATEDV